ncbi:MAG TPA: DUF2254 domain-containing protein [Alphaproteobacteria bacterium]|nr:DUF2254 domain-containing protein [Alphaproteobacteria bacterium]
MSWSRWYAIKSYLLSTIWIAPVIALALEQLTFRIPHSLQFDFGVIPGFIFDKEGTIAVANFAITESIAFLAFTFSSLLVAIQVASGQLTPRIIATMLLRDKPIRRSVAMFVYTLMLAAAVSTRPDTIPRFLVSLVGLLGIVELVVFMFLIDYAARLLRPVSIVVRIAQRGLKVIEEVYPRLLKEMEAGTPATLLDKLGPPERTVLHRGTSAIVIALNLKALAAAATRADCVIEFVPQVGDFVGAGEPLLLLRGPGAKSIDERKLRGWVAFGTERTIEQDSMFAFRVITDIALKALSPAINDPTTAVLAIDQLQRLLRTVGQRVLQDEVIRDADGRVRLIFRTPNWGDFVYLTFTELRQYGGQSVQVMRRLRAMIDSVMEAIPESRRPALRQELHLLDRTAERAFVFPEDLALARVPDSQGMGGTIFPEAANGQRDLPGLVSIR